VAGPAAVLLLIARPMSQATNAALVLPYLAPEGSSAAAVEHSADQSAKKALGDSVR
jgi:hypothetical protein